MVTSTADSTVPIPMVNPVQSANDPLYVGKNEAI
ncbi:unnamed protein product [Rhodiola kirilowii]